MAEELRRFGSAGDIEPRVLAERLADELLPGGLVTGGDPNLKNSYVIYTAHWDHFGIGPEVNGDKIYHGAVDNASGSAALLEMARAYKMLRTPPRRRYAIARRGKLGLQTCRAVSVQRPHFATQGR